MGDLYDKFPSKTAGVAPAAEEIKVACGEIQAMLLEKNAAYGSSALDPVRIFSRADTVEQLNVRIDDKLSRIARGREHGNDDTELDLLGYLILLRIAKKRAMMAKERKRESEHRAAGLGCG